MNKPKNISILEFKQKVVKIFIHGFIHLLGYDHIKLKDFKKMIKEEEEIYEVIKNSKCLIFLKKVSKVLSIF